MSTPTFMSAPVAIQQFSPPPPKPPPLHPYTCCIDSRGRRKSFCIRSSGNNNYPEIDTASWTSSISHLCKSGRLSEAIQQFTRMRESGIEPNHVTFVTLFSGCAKFPAQGAVFGSSVHGYARKMGLDVENVLVGTTVIDMYSKFGEMGLARLSFDHMSVKLKNKVSWNAMVNGYMRVGAFEEAIKLFDEMPDRDAVSWTALIDGFVKNGRFEEALDWFQDMQFAGEPPDFVTIVSVLSAVANLGTLGLGLWLHRFVLMQDFGDNTRINNSLVDMYCRCGCVKLARQVFDNMSNRNLVSWNSIIVGLACNACTEEALNYFLMMHRNGFQPDGVTFTGALTACNHAGFVDEGVKLFEAMKKVHNISPRIEHYGCIVDLYSRAGRLKEAMLVVESMPMKPNEVILGSLLAACRACEDIELAEKLMNHINSVDPKSNFNYVLLSNIYAATGSWRGAGKTRKTMKFLGVQKRPGVSMVEVNGSIHEFMAGDKYHADSESIYMILNHLSDELRLYDHAKHIDFLEA